MAPIQHGSSQAGDENMGDESIGESDSQKAPHLQLFPARVGCSDEVDIHITDPSIPTLGIRPAMSLQIPFRESFIRHADAPNRTLRPFHTTRSFILALFILLVNQDAYPIGRP
jgi:hypothetical protein